MRYLRAEALARRLRTGRLRVVGVAAAIVLGTASLGMSSVSPASAAPGGAGDEASEGAAPSVSPAAALKPAVEAASNGPVLATGLNVFGQLGNGTTTDAGVPVPTSLPPGTAITDVSAGFDHSVAVTSAGDVLSWGFNAFGQLGNGSTTDTDMPVPTLIPPGTTIKDVSAGFNYSVALTSKGEVLAWGHNQHGQLGNGTNTNSAIPVAVHLPPGVVVTAISAGGFHVVALTSAGAVLTWGFNSVGQLGNGTDTDPHSSNVPVVVHLPPGVTATAVAGGGQHSTALTSTGTVLAWGYNDHGQLGTGTTDDSNVPVLVHLPGDVIATGVSAGFGHTVALTSTGGMLSWGSNTNGELGTGSTNTFSSDPLRTLHPPGVTIRSLSTGSSAFHTMALSTSGQLFSWGYNAFGQLGNGTSISTVPREVTLPSNTTVTGFATGFGHSLLITLPPW